MARLRSLQFLLAITLTIGHGLKRMRQICYNTMVSSFMSSTMNKAAFVNLLKNQEEQ